MPTCGSLALSWHRKVRCLDWWLLDWCDGILDLMKCFCEPLGRWISKALGRQFGKRWELTNGWSLPWHPILSREGFQSLIRPLLVQCLRHYCPASPESICWQHPNPYFLGKEPLLIWHPRGSVALTPPSLGCQCSQWFKPSQWDNCIPFHTMIDSRTGTWLKPSQSETIAKTQENQNK